MAVNQTRCTAAAVLPWFPRFSPRSLLAANRCLVARSISSLFSPNGRWDVKNECGPVTANKSRTFGRLSTKPAPVRRSWNALKVTYWVRGDRVERSLANELKLMRSRDELIVTWRNRRISGRTLYLIDSRSIGFRQSFKRAIEWYAFHSHRTKHEKGSRGEKVNDFRIRSGQVYGEVLAADWGRRNLIIMIIFRGIFVPFRSGPGGVWCSDRHLFRGAHSFLAGPWLISQVNWPSSSTYYQSIF